MTPIERKEAIKAALKKESPRLNKLLTNTYNELIARGDKPPFASFMADLARRKEILKIKNSL